MRSAGWIIVGLGCVGLLRYLLVSGRAPEALLKPRGFRTDVQHMTRHELLTGGAVLGTCGAAALVAYFLIIAPYLERRNTPDHPLVLGVAAGLALLGIAGLAGGLYLILRGCFRRRDFVPPLRADLEFVYAGQSLDELLALGDQYRTDCLVRAAQDALASSLRWRDTEQLTRPEVVVLVLGSFEYGISRGGFHEALRSLPASLLGFVAVALREIGCPRSAAIAERAITALGPEPPATDEELAVALDAPHPERDEALRGFTDAFFDVREPLSGRLLDYMKVNRGSIRVRAHDARF